jgi:hypothetical protein
LRRRVPAVMGSDQSLGHLAAEIEIGNADRLEAAQHEMRLLSAILCPL